MPGDLFYHYREFSDKTLEVKLNVTFSGRRECNKDDPFTFERLKVDDDNSHRHGSVQHFLVSKVLSAYLVVRYLFLVTVLGRNHGSRHPIFADEINVAQKV